MNQSLREIGDEKSGRYKMSPAEKRTGLKKVPAMDRAFAEHGVVTDSDIVVYRGVGSNHPIKSSTRGKVGTEFTDHGYVSSSTKSSKAESYVGREGGTGVVLEITVPKGSRLLAGDARESELIAPRSSTFRVTGRSGGRVQVELINTGSPSLDLSIYGIS